MKKVQPFIQGRLFASCAWPLALATVVALAGGCAREEATPDPGAPHGALATSQPPAARGTPNVAPSPGPVTAPSDDRLGAADAGDGASAPHTTAAATLDATDAGDAASPHTAAAKAFEGVTAAGQVLGAAR
jgi:hypothetical protein